MFACKQEQAENVVIQKHQVDITAHIQDTTSKEEYDIDAYFNRYKIQPMAIVLNTYTESEISIFYHKIKWIDKDGMNTIRIDGKLIDLETKVTLNPVWDKGGDSVKFINNWDEIKYYRLNGNEFIAVRMHFNPFAGLGCSVYYFLVYDFKNKTENYFGTFRTDEELNLYSFNNNDQIDYLSRTFVGDAQGATEMNFITELYSLNKKGAFVLQKDSNGAPFQINQTIFSNDTTKKNIQIIIHWFENIKE